MIRFTDDSSKLSIKWAKADKSNRAETVSTAGSDIEMDDEPDPRQLTRHSVLGM